MKRYVLDARTATAHFPGIGRYVSQLARHLVPLLAADEQLVLLHRPQEDSWPLPEASNNVAVVATTVSPFSLAQQWQLPRLLRQLDATIYHSAYYLMPYRPGVPTLLTLYDLIPEQFPQLVSFRAQLFARLATRLSLRAASRLLAISEATKQAFLAAHYISYTKIAAFPLAADDRFKPQTEAIIATLRQKRSLPDRYVLYLGINKPHKNLLRLVDAWAEVVQAVADAPPLIIAGAWDARYGEVKTAVSQQKLTEHIKFIGAVEDVDLPALYSGATLFVFPSLVEGFGLPVLEAMACGTAVACANTSSLPEVGGEAVAYFDPTNTQQIAQTLQTLLQDEAALTVLAQKGQEQAAKFSWEKTAVATLTQYRHLAQTAQTFQNPL
ncbi:glycosyltransferase family 4 protein [Candidatus Leptofilum sp.]|uniref:glycosyltransferase family 4 protein n=1 Tax=Candidatus Leptofilum sp. TaxID=3241576 RepID=UPI003B59E72F